MSNFFKGDANYDGLSPQTTKGDLAVYGAAGSTRLSVGADGTFPKADSSQPLGIVWASPAGANLSVATLTGATTLTSGNDVVLVSGTTFAITMPNCLTNNGKLIRIKKTDQGFNTPISVVGITTTQLIEGVAGITLSTVNEMFELTAGTSHWHLTNHFIDPNIGNLTPIIYSFSGGTLGSFVSQRFGDVLEMTGGFKTTVTGSSVACMGVPSQLTVNSSFIATSAGSSAVSTHCGDLYSHNGSFGSNNLHYAMAMGGATLGTLFLCPSGTGLGYQKVNADGAGFFGTANWNSFKMRIQIQGWKG